MMKCFMLLSSSIAILGCSDSPAPSDEGSASAESRTPAATEESTPGHEHAEVSLGTIEVGGLRVDLAQGHGAVAAGKEGHLVVELPYSDGGSTIVRAWIGGEDRTLSRVAKGEYSPTHDDYDVHATAPDPLPEDARWWIELELPSGDRPVGSVAPILE